MALQTDLHVDERVEEASTLPAKFYKDREIYETVKENIFARSWQWVGDLDMVKVPGQVSPFTLLEGCLDEPIVITRDTKDAIHCLSNVCTHRGMQVAEGCSNERFLRCRYHGRRFGLDGKFQQMPEFEGVCGFPSERDDMPKVPHGFWGPWVFAGVNPTMSLSDWLAPMEERLGWLPLNEFRHDPARQRDYMIKANWALYLDNYLEGFHIPFIHAGLNEIIDYGNYTNELYRWSNLQLAVAADGQDCFDLPASSPDYGKRISAYYYWLFPNTMFNVYPWGISVNVVRPLGPELTKVTFIPYVWREERRDLGAGSELDRVEREDEAVVELVQRGVKSRFYDKGRYSVAREKGVHHFHRLIAEALGSV